MGARHPLPYAWAKAYSLLIEDDGRHRTLHVTDATSRTALAEVLRLHSIDRIEREVASVTCSVRWRPSSSISREYALAQA